MFKHWARNPQAEIVDVNVQGTRNVLRAAAEAGVRRVVYVSSVAAVGHNGQRLDENSWNTDQDNPYYRSKILSERASPFRAALRSGSRTPARTCCPRASSARTRVLPRCPLAPVTIDSVFMDCLIR